MNYCRQLLVKDAFITSFVPWVASEDQHRKSLNTNKTAVTVISNKYVVTGEER